MSLSVIFSCKECSAAFSIPLGDPEMHLLEQLVPCTTYGCSGQLKEVKTTNARLTRITAHALFMAAMGAGLPNERNCPPKEMEALLKNKTIVSVELTSSPDPKRTIISSITVGDKVLHLSAGNKGATIYKVTDVKRPSRSPSKGGAQTGSTTGGGAEEKSNASTATGGGVRPHMPGMQTTSPIYDQHDGRAAFKELRMQDRKASPNKPGGLRTSSTRRKA